LIQIDDGNFSRVFNRSSNTVNLWVLKGCSGDVKEVAEGWLAGNLKDSGIACNLHEHGCHEA
jgi:hypothetical protein